MVRGAELLVHVAAVRVCGEAALVGRAGLPCLLLCCGSMPVGLGGRLRWLLLLRLCPPLLVVGSGRLRVLCVGRAAVIAGVHWGRRTPQGYWLGRCRGMRLCRGVHP